MGESYTDKVLHDFKLVIKHQMILIRNASNAQTAYFYWINRSRQQFVLEARSTKHTGVMFQDRISFDQHFLNDFKDIDKVKQINVGSGKQLDPAELTHYSDPPAVSALSLIPLQNDRDTVAITVLEHGRNPDESSFSSVVESYVSALENMMETYMQINHLDQEEKQWEEYEKYLSDFHQDYRNEAPAEIVDALTEQLTGYLSQGGVIMMGKEGEDWVSLWNEVTSRQEERVVPGLKMEKGSIAGACREEQDVVYLSHLNGSPKRISSREPDHYGATLAVPIFVNNIMQMMVLIYDQNPLVFKNAVKHKLLNFVRLSGHMIAVNWSHHNEYDLLRTDDRHIFRMDVWQRIAERYLESSNRSEVRLGIGRLKLTNSHNLRAKLRLEQLNKVENQIIERSRPVHMGLPGFLGHIQEFAYAVILPITQDETISYYERCLMERKNKPFKLHTNEAVNAEMEVSFTVVSAGAEALNWQRLVDSLR